MCSNDAKWLPIFRATYPVELAAVQDLLQDEGIEVAVLDQRDRMYPMLGEVVLWVLEKDQEHASRLLEVYQKDEQLREKNA